MQLLRRCHLISDYSFLDIDTYIDMIKKILFIYVIEGDLRLQLL
jgi:hypothetical protein